jgi:hypothetical protein
MSAGSSIGRTVSGVLFGAVVVVLAAVLFFTIWLFESPSNPFNALLTIGTVALIFALVCYLLQALVSRPILARAASWGFLAMGFTVVFATVAIYPYASVGNLSRLYIGVAYLFVLAVALFGFYWRAGELHAESRRKEHRQDWVAQPSASAFDYTAARPANVPPPPSVNAPTAPPPSK